MYDLFKLGWHSFQQLCLAITREILGQTVESFLDTNDGGRDGAFAGFWNPKGNENLSGRFVIQCKFTSKAEYILKASDLKDEALKARRLSHDGRCDCYILLTNAFLTGNQASKVENLFKDQGLKNILLLGSTWICQQIIENKRLRMLVPRIYGLGDLSQILDERAYSQARTLIESLREDMSKIVVTGAYLKAVEALDKHGFVLLIGEPAAGKTTIASQLAMAALDQWDASTLKLDEPGKVIEHWNPDEPSQFFWIDDAFGVTQYESFLVHGWNHILPQIKTMLRKGAKIIMTSRDYIYNRARKDLKESAFPLLQESQVVINVHDLTGDEKRQILYNHLKLGRQPAIFRSEIKPHLEYVASHHRFIPETARRLSEPVFTNELHVNRYDLERFIDKQERFLQEVLEGLDSDSKAALALIYMRNGVLGSPIELAVSENRAVERLCSTLGGCIGALAAMNGSLVQHTHVEGNSVWCFKHPTVGDSYANLLIRNPELLGIYVQGSPTEKLIAQVTCGDIGVERAVVLPKILFPLMLERLAEFVVTGKAKASLLLNWNDRSRLMHFLSSRCSREFLSLYIERNPEILDEVECPGLLLSAVPEVQFAVRLHENHLLPEDSRRSFIKTVAGYALEGEDLFVFESAAIRSIFTVEEFKEFRTNVQNILLPKISDVLHYWQGNFRSDDSAEDYIQPLLDSFQALKKEFAGDLYTETAIEEEMELAQEWITEKTSELSEKASSQPIGKVQTSNGLGDGRSIFDDIDE